MCVCMCMCIYIYQMYLYIFSVFKILDSKTAWNIYFYVFIFILLSELLTKRWKKEMVTHHDT